ncbi:hypothetical protein KW789_02935 [Candidatus Saccharibacteria bacterium]|jgi:hypothetical protein|nr:hypothetical protein [Candidatus Saccharibacteria bacterium]
MIIAFLVGVIIFGAAVLFVLTKMGPRFNKRLQKGLNQEYFQDRWLELLARVKTSPEGMVLAVIDADKLLDEALRRRHFRGKTMGERLVAAQRSLSDNDAVWYAHKLRNRLVHEPNVKLKKTEAQNALQGFRRGLKDLGAI